MFRISELMRALVRKEDFSGRGKPSGPVVIWNLIRRCNLACKHCYSISADIDFDGELKREELFTVMDDLKAFGVPVLILSGGEPLLHPHIFELSRRARRLGFYVGLSTNGTLIDEAMADRIAEIGYPYVGISLDGIGATHDHFRRQQGAFEKSLNALRLCRARGIKVGVRYTMTQDNADELPALMQLCIDEQIDKFYFSHLNYAGRGNRNRKDDAFLHSTRAAMDRLFAQAQEDAENGIERDWVTGNNDADGVYLLQWAAQRFPDRLADLRARLTHWGGNSSGVNIANIDNLGNVHPDTMWWHYTLGNVRERPFSQIWQDLSDPILAGLKQHPRPVQGRCGACQFLSICNGNTRVRAMQLTGNPWAEDPACYLDDAELGIESSAERLSLRPWSRQRDGHLVVPDRIPVATEPSA